MSKLAYVGLGKLGGAIAKRLIESGFDVSLYNRSFKRAELLAQQETQAYTTPAAAVQDCDFIFTCLPARPELNDVFIGENGILAGAKPGSIWIDNSTVMPNDALDIATLLEKRQVGSIDCPIGGNPEHAAKGELTLMLGGDDDLVAKALPVLKSLGNVNHLGKLGCGHKVKLVNNYMAALINAVTAEGITMLEKADINRDEAIAVLKRTNADNRFLSTVYPNKVFKGQVADARFTLNMALKDLQQALNMAQDLQVALFTGQAARILLTNASIHGEGEHDTSSLLNTVRRLSGLPVNY